MQQQIRLWRFSNTQVPQELARSQLSSEDLLETWLEQDISMIDPGLLVIGRQVPTDYGSKVDLLCLDAQGDVVILELKRDKTPRDVTAQALDYATWVQGLSHERITEIGERYFGGPSTLEDAFRRKLGDGLPDILNEDHRILIVASEMDPSSEPIVRYLNGAGIDINVATFQCFRDTDGTNLLGRVFLVEPTETAARPAAGSKRAPKLSYEQLQAWAEERGVGELYRHLVEGLDSIFRSRDRSRSTQWWKMQTDSGGPRAVFTLLPGESSAAQGVRYQIYLYRLATALGQSSDDIRKALPEGAEEWVFWRNPPPETPEGDWRGYAGYLRNEQQAERLLAVLRSDRDSGIDEP